MFQIVIAYKCIFSAYKTIGQYCEDVNFITLFANSITLL